MEKVRIRWAPRVSRDQVRRLYDSDAQGRLDLDLLDDPVRRFRQTHAWEKVRGMARELGIPAPADTEDQRSVVEEILRKRKT
jgi:hypothetical protein